jgi:hypothetical protein
MKTLGNKVAWSLTSEMPEYGLLQARGIVALSLRIYLVQFALIIEPSVALEPFWSCVQIPSAQMSCLVQLYG